MIKLCADIGTGYVQGLSMAAAMKGKTLQEMLGTQYNKQKRRNPGPPGSCFNCGQPGHIARNYPTGKNVFQKRPNTPGLCPKCRRGNHWANECRSERDKDGNMITGQNSGNGCRGLTQA